MATMEMASVTQELSEPEEENEKKVRDDVPKPVALQAPALRTNVDAAWEDPGSWTHVCVNGFYLCLFLKFHHT